MRLSRPYQNHLRSSDDLVTSYEAIRAGFVSLALEKNRRSTSYVAEARALKQAASQARTPADLLTIEGIEAGLLAAAGVSEKALAHLLPEDKAEAINNLIQNFLEPAGEKFVEELVFRFLLTRGDTLGGSMRNIGGVLAQRKLTRAIISSLTIAGISYRWQHSKTRQWVEMSDDDSEIELSLRGLNWKNNGQPRTLVYNLTVPLVKNNVDICLLSPLQKLTTEHTERTERVRFMNKRINFCHQAHVRKIFTALFLIKDKIIFSLVKRSPFCREVFIQS